MTPGSDTVRRLAPAKLNLRLRVLQRDEAGYHGVETLMLSLDLSDTVELSPGRAGIRIEVEGNPAVPADSTNLCWRAAEAVFHTAGIDPRLTIRLRKRIPSSAGLGGGSSDAAAVLVGLNDMLDRPLEFSDLLAIAGGLGSDVPFGLIDDPFAFAWERGRRLMPLGPPPARPVLIAVPPFGVSAADAYRWLAADRSSGEAGSARKAGSTASSAPVSGFILPRPEALAGWAALDRLVCNDLERPVFGRHPELGVIRDELLRQGARHAVLCGSGSCVAGIFESEVERDRAAMELERAAGVGTIRTATIGPDAG